MAQDQVPAVETTLEATPAAAKEEDLELTITPPPPAKRNTRRALEVERTRLAAALRQKVSTIAPVKAKPTGPGFDRPHTLASAGIKGPPTGIPLLKLTLTDKKFFTNPVAGILFTNSVAIVRMDKTDSRLRSIGVNYQLRVQTGDEVMAELQERVGQSMNEHLEEFNNDLDSVPPAEYDSELLIVKHPWLDSQGNWVGIPQTA